MIAAPTISAAPPDDPVLDWSALVDEGRALLGAMSDGRWTDFNVHDPGITILELVAYALTDLGYRASHAMPDLLAGSAPLLGPAASLTTLAVTPDDLRRIGLDVAGVRNLWLEPGSGPGLRLRHSSGTGELVLAGGTAAEGEAVQLEGVYRVLIEKSSRQDLASASLARAVALRLHAERNLCEDFEAFAVLEPQPVIILADVEIADAARADAVLLDIFARLDAYVSPGAYRRSVAALRAEGTPSDAIYDGPALERGVCSLPPGGGRRILHLSDVIAELAQAPGVRATRRVRLGRSLDEADRGPLAWSLAIEEGRAPAFDVAGSHIRLRAAGAVALDSAQRPDLARRFADSLRDAAELSEAMREPPPPSGRDRRLATYRPLRLDLPLAYGVQPGALGRDATPERRGQANQLRGYLAMFDLLLAAQFSQLAGARELMAAQEGDGRSYFAPALEHAPDEAPLYSAALDPDALQRLVEVPGSEAAAARRARFLGHLLARFGESAPSAPRPPGEQEGTGDSGRMVQTRAAFLRDFPRLSAGRGTGANLLVDGDESPLLARIRLKLGLPAAAAGPMLLIEHILLRGLSEDNAALPLLSAAARANPYSRQISVVVDASLDAQPGDRDIVARVVREECPAHIIVYMHWLAPDAFAALAQSHARWMVALRRARREELGLAGAPA